MANFLGGSASRRTPTLFVLTVVQSAPWPAPRVVVDVPDEMAGS